MELTSTDRIILGSYAAAIDGLGAYLGSAYEISLHSLEDLNHSVVKIVNGYHSGRSVGAPLTDLARNMLKRISDQGISASASYTSYEVTTSRGEQLRSSTIPIIGERGNVIGMLCINFYLDTPLSELLSNLVPDKERRNEKESFAATAAEMINEAIADARSQVLQDTSIPSVMKNKELVRILHDKGIFNMKDSVVKVAESLGVSRNTIYMHIRNIKEEQL